MALNFDLKKAKFSFLLYRKSLLQENSIIKALKEIKEHSENTKPRQFLETLEFQIALKNIDVKNTKRLVGSIRLPNVTKPKFKVCLFGSAEHCDQAKKLGIECLNVDQIKEINRDKKKVKKLVRAYDAFIASSTIIKLVPRYIGPTLSRIGKFPTTLAVSEKVEDKLKEIISTIKFNVKFKDGGPMILNFPFANVKMTDEEILDNAHVILNYSIGMLKNKMNNVRRVHMKSTMGKPHRIYGY